MSVSESQQDVVRSDGDSLRSSEYEGSIIHFLHNHVQPGMEFFVIHLELVGANDGLAGSVLIDTYNSINSSNPFLRVALNSMAANLMLSSDTTLTSY